MSGISQNDPDELREMVDRHVNALSEHFDTVQIYVTRQEGEKDQTRGINRGAGNWFARFGQVREWVVYEEERMRECARPNREE